MKTGFTVPYDQKKDDYDEQINKELTRRGKSSDDEHEYGYIVAVPRSLYERFKKYLIQ